MWRDFCCHQRGEATAATKSSHASPFPGQVLALYAPLSWRRASVAQLRPCCCSGRNQSSALCFAQRAKKRAALGSHPAGPSLLLHRQRWQLSGCCFTPPPSSLPPTYFSCARFPAVDTASVSVKISRSCYWYQQNMDHAFRQCNRKKKKKIIAIYPIFSKCFEGMELHLVISTGPWKVKTTVLLRYITLLGTQRYVLASQVQSPGN